MNDSLDVSGWISSARQFKPVTIVDIIAQLNSLRAEVMRLTAERDEARRIARQMKAERDALRERYDALLRRTGEAQAFRYATEED